MKKILILSLIFLFMISGCKKEKKTIEKPQDTNVTITLAEYKKIEKGMSLDSVNKIIGGSCNLIENNDKTINEIKYVCSGMNAGSSATLIFDDEKLLSKSQENLQ